MRKQKDSISLADIQDEIQLMRDEAEKRHSESMKQFQQSSTFTAYAIGGAVVFLGISFLTPMLSCYAQKINARGFIAIGMGFAIYCWLKARRLRRR